MSSAGTEGQGLSRAPPKHISKEEDTGIEAGASTPLKQAERIYSLYGHEKKTAYYNHASEKSIRHAEAKLMYPRHVSESFPHDLESKNHPLRVQTWSSGVDGEIDLRRVASHASRKLMLRMWKMYNAVSEFEHPHSIHSQLTVGLFR